MKFELFTDYGAASRQVISIRESGLVYVSNALVRECVGSDPEMVNSYRFYTDKNSNTIAIEFGVDGSEGDGWRSFSKTQKTKSGVLANAMPVLRAFGFQDKGFHKAELEAEPVSYGDVKVLTFSVEGVEKK